VPACLQYISDVLLISDMCCVWDIKKGRRSICSSQYKELSLYDHGHQIPFGLGFFVIRGWILHILMLTQAHFKIKTQVRVILVRSNFLFLNNRHIWLLYTPLLTVSCFCVLSLGTLWWWPSWLETGRCGQWPTASSLTWQWRTF
jgi:hypothetical protein